jgi:hypothetical protein
MKCPTCVEEGKKSKVYIGETTSTLIMAYEYYDEDGNYHYDDPNIRETRYWCSNRHEWTVRRQRGKIIDETTTSKD